MNSKKSKENKENRSFKVYNDLKFKANIYSRKLEKLKFKLTNFLVNINLQKI